MQKIITPPPSEEYKNNYDKIFGKSKEQWVSCSYCDTLNKATDAVCKNCGEELKSNG